MILDAPHRIVNHRQSLSREEAREVMAEVFTGNCTDAQIAARSSQSLGLSTVVSV